MKLLDFEHHNKYRKNSNFNKKSIYLFSNLIISLKEKLLIHIFAISSRVINFL